MIRSLGVVFIIFLFGGLSVFADPIHTYEFEIVRAIPKGRMEGEIGRNSIAEGGPAAFAVSSDYKLYVTDKLNTRINVYDASGLFLYALDTAKTEAHFALDMTIGPEGNIIVAGMDGVMQLSPSGEIMREIEREKLPMERSIILKELSFQNGNIFFYDKEGYVRGVDPNGKVMGNAEATQALRKMNERSGAAGKMSESAKTDNEQFSDRKHIMVGDRYLPRSWDELRDSRKELTVKSPAVPGQAPNKKSVELDVGKLGLAVTRFLGFDKDENLYYIFATPESDYGVLVSSKYGDTLDVFYVNKRGDPKSISVSLCSVAPNGDIYFLTYKDPDYVFYRLKRRW